LFDLMLAVAPATSNRCRITVVYGELLPAHLRFLLADDPGAGKTIMAGLYIKAAFSDVKRCLIVCRRALGADSCSGCTSRSRPTRC
jgi:hypothetical protein